MPVPISKVFVGALDSSAFGIVEQPLLSLRAIAEGGVSNRIRERRGFRPGQPNRERYTLPRPIDSETGDRSIGVVPTIEPIISGCFNELICNAFVRNRSSKNGEEQSDDGWGDNQNERKSNEIPS